MMGHGDNARNRAFLFSTKMNHYREFVRDMCQCPQSGFPHFYEQRKQETENGNSSVSMPSIGLSSFLQEKIWNLLSSFLMGVNALNRAFLISTVPLGNPLFTRLSRPIFVSNSQNILIIHFFSLFFWLVLLSVKISVHITLFFLFPTLYLYYTPLSKILNPCCIFLLI